MNTFKLFLTVFTIAAASLLPQINGDVSNLSLESLLNTQIKTASKYWQNINEAPASVSIITYKDIQAYGYNTLAEILQSVRSFYISNDRNYFYLGVRGFSRPSDYNNRILILINGHPMNENVSGSVPLENQIGIDISLIDRIEIVRGPGSVLYGNNAMFAVINIITKTGKNFNVFNVAVEQGSYGYYSGFLNFGKEFENGLNLFSSLKYGRSTGQNLYFKEFDSDSTNYGIAEKIDGEEFYGFYSLIDYKGLSFHGYAASRYKQVPNAPFGSLFNDATTTVDSRYFAELKYEHELDYNKNFLIRGYYDNYFYKGNYPYLEDKIVDYLDDNSGNWYGAEAQFAWDVSSLYKFTVGAEISKDINATYSYWNESTSFFDGSFPKTIYSLYNQNEFQLDNFIFSLSCRADKIDSKNFNLSPRLSIIYSPDQQLNLKFLIGEAFRNPTVYEANYFDYYSGYKPNYNLRYEKIRSLEFLIEEKFSPQLFGTVSFFHNFMSNLIDTHVDPVDSLIQFVNLSKSQAYGIEFEINSTFIKGMKSFINFTFQHSEGLNSKQKLSNVPSFIANAGFIWNISKEFSMAPVFKFETKRKTVRNTFTDNYFLCNINLRYQLLDFLNISLKVNNLFNKAYAYPGGFEHSMDGIIQENRNYIIKANFEF